MIPATKTARACIACPKNKVAIDLIVQHIRDFLNNRSSHGSTGNMALYMNLDLGRCEEGADMTSGTYNAIRRFSTLCKELTMTGNVFFETNKNLPHH